MQGTRFLSVGRIPGLKVANDSGFSPSQTFAFFSSVDLNPWWASMVLFVVEPRLSAAY